MWGRMGTQRWCRAGSTMAGTEDNIDNSEHARGEQGDATRSEGWLRLSRHVEWCVLIRSRFVSRVDRDTIGDSCCRGTALSVQSTLKHCNSVSNVGAESQMLFFGFTVRRGRAWRPVGEASASTMRTARGSGRSQIQEICVSEIVPERLTDRSTHDGRCGTYFGRNHHLL